MSLISEESNARDEVLKVLTESYGDASVTILDYRAATAIVARMRELGWLSPQEFAVLTLDAVRDAASAPTKKVVSLTISDQAILAFEDRPAAVVTRLRRPEMFASKIFIEQDLG